MAWTAAVLPGMWVPVLASFVLRTKADDASGKAFYAMAKYSPYQVHFTITQFLFLGFPLLALLAAWAIHSVSRRAPDFHRSRAWCLLAGAIGLSIAVIAFNPGGYFLWFFD